MLGFPDFYRFLLSKLQQLKRFTDLDEWQGVYEDASEEEDPPHKVIICAHKISHPTARSTYKTWSFQRRSHCLSQRDISRVLQHGPTCITIHGMIPKGMGCKLQGRASADQPFLFFYGTLANLEFDPS